MGCDGTLYLLYCKDFEEPRLVSESVTREKKDRRTPKVLGSEFHPRLVEGLSSQVQE